MSQNRSQISSRRTATDAPANRLRQSFTDWSACRGLSEEQAVDTYRQAAKVGYLAVEMAPPHRWAQARDLGLSLLNITAPGMDEGLNFVKNHRLLLRQIKALIDVAAREQITQIVVFSGKRNGQSDSDGIGCCIDALMQLAPLAEQNNVSLLLELLGQECHPDYHADNIQFGAEVIRAVRSRAVKLLYDIYHMHAMGEAVIPTIVEHLDCIGHLHVASRIQRGEPRASDPIRYSEIVHRVMHAGYTGLWGQEFLVDQQPGDALTRAYKLFDGMSFT